MFAVLEKFWPLLIAKAGNGDSTTAIVRTLRAWYGGSIVVILVAWYSGWRNKNTAPGDVTNWPIPGISKTNNGTNTVSRPDPDTSSYSADAILDPTSTTSLGAMPGVLPTQDLGPTPANTGSMHTKLYTLAQSAQRSFGLRVSEYPPFGPVHPVHSRNSLHYQGRAFDASGSPAAMAAFANYVKINFGRNITELIHNPGYSIKNGSVVPPNFWGAEVWAQHRNHVHVAI